jgi:hypothetical protein
MADDVKTIKDWLFVRPEEKCVSIKLPDGWHCDITGVDSGMRLDVESSFLPKGTSLIGHVVVKAERHCPAPEVVNPSKEKSPC